MEAAVRWSPHSTPDRERFLIIGLSDHTLTLNQVDRRVGRDAVESHVVTRQPHLVGINAFDWFRNDESLVVLGLKTGSANLIRLREQQPPQQPQQQHEEQSPIVAQFKPRQERKCNSIASSTDNWLAVGLDRTRADPQCLNIFDATISGQVHSEPIRRLCNNEPVTSVRFFPTHPQELLAAAQRSVIRLYDLRDGSPGNNAAAQTTTRNVHNISIDPLDENYFASCGSTGEPTATIWDKRWMLQSIPGGNTTGTAYDFRSVVDTPGASIWGMRYSGQKRGRLALCSSAGELRVIDTVEGRQSNIQNSSYLPTNPYGGPGWTFNRYVSQIRSAVPPYDEKRDGAAAQAKVVAFDWVASARPTREQSLIVLRPNGKVRLLQVPSVIAQATVTARNDFSLAYDDVSITETKSVGESVRPQAPYEQKTTAEDFGPTTYKGEEDEEEQQRGKVKCGRDSPHIARLLAPSMLQRERCRRGYLFNCQLNREIVAGNWQLERLWEIVGRFREQAAHKGMVAESLDLSYVGVAGIWSEKINLGPQRRLSDSPTTIADAIVGLNVALDIPAFEGQRTEFSEHRQLCLALCGWKFTTDTLEAECQELIDRGLYYQAIVQAVLHGYTHIALNLLRTLIRSKTVPNIGLNALLASDSINAEQREMCLWMAADTDDPALKALLTYLATGDWRDVMKTNYLHLGYRVSLGLKYLNDTELAGFLQSETARAIKNGDLEGILLTGLAESSTLDLLQTYIARTGDLQTAVLATAFTHPLYAQTATAAAEEATESLGALRWSMWKETYFDQLQRWRAFAERTRFVVQHTQLMRSSAHHRGGGGATAERSALPAAQPSQITLRCNHCQSSLARHEAGRPLLFGEVARPAATNTPGGVAGISGTAPAAGAGAVAPNARVLVGPAANAGIVCPKCGRHMPRCGICKLWLGTPDPARAAAVAVPAAVNSTAAGAGAGAGATSASASGQPPGSSGGPGGAAEAAARKKESEKARLEAAMAKFLTFCLRCGHGFHANHARGWFERHSVCPVPDCRCLCTVS